MFLVGCGCPRGERRSEIRTDSKIFRGLNPSKNLDKRLNLALGEAAKCRENLHMAKNDKYRKRGKIDSWIEKIKLSINFHVSSVCVSQPYLWDSEKDIANGFCLYFVGCILDLCALLSSVSFLYI